MGNQSKIKDESLQPSGKRSNAFALLLLLAIFAACGIAGHGDEQDQQELSNYFTPAVRSRIVASWSEPEAITNLSVIPPGEQAAAKQ